MTWPVTSAAMKRLRAAISNLASAVTELISGAYGPVTPTYQMQRRAGRQLLERDRLEWEIREARHKHRPVKHLHKQASLVTHKILARGLK